MQALSAQGAKALPARPTVPAKTKGDDVEALLETARAIRAELTLLTRNPRHRPRRRQSCANGGPSADLTAPVRESSWHYPARELEDQARSYR